VQLLCCLFDGDSAGETRRRQGNHAAAGNSVLVTIPPMVDVGGPLLERFDSFQRIAIDCCKPSGGLF